MFFSKILETSEDSLSVIFEQKICPEVNREVSAFTLLFKSASRYLKGIVEVVPAYCSVTIYFNKKICKKNHLKKGIIKTLKKIENLQNENCNEENSYSKTINIPVCYEEEFAPDLDNVSKTANLTKEEVINLHSSTEYLIYMLGFLPGFPYLGGLSNKLETPRLETPRTKIPSGSIAIGGKQTGLYPIDSPGGWNIIGKTPLKVFDINREPKFLYNAGDKIKFISISKKEFETFSEKKWLKENGYTNNLDKNKKEKKETYVCGGGIKILEPGLMTTVQDSGICGFQKYGISQSGAMDNISFSLANKICGNEENAACLETTVMGPALSFTTDMDFAITGAEFLQATLNENSIEMNKKIHAKAGDILTCGFSSKGIRSYIAFNGGILVPKKFNSSSTNIKSGIGGLNGKKLEKNCELAIGQLTNSRIKKINLEKEINPFFLEKDSLLTLECIKSTQFDFFEKEEILKFLNSTFTLSEKSDRMGLRFEGESLTNKKTDIISDSIPFGAVQITSKGLPVVMASDRQTTGGYAKIACVKNSSMCKLVQAKAGTKIKFKITD